MSSVGGLVVTFTVAAAVIWRRYYSPEENSLASPLWRMVTSTLACTDFAVAYERQAHWGLLVTASGVWLLTALFFFLLPQVYTLSGFSMPLVPLTVGGAIFGSALLICSLGYQAFNRFLAVLVACSLPYLLHGVHAAGRHDQDAADHLAARTLSGSAGEQPGRQPGRERRAGQAVAAQAPKSFH